MQNHHIYMQTIPGDAGIEGPVLYWTVLNDCDPLRWKLKVMGK